MINLLNNQDDSEMFMQNTIRLFVELLWQHYQPAIVWKAFIPYVLYMCSFIILAMRD